MNFATPNFNKAVEELKAWCCMHAWFSRDGQFHFARRRLDGLLEIIFAALSTRLGFIFVRNRMLDAVASSANARVASMDGKLPEHGNNILLALLLNQRLILDSIGLAGLRTLQTSQYRFPGLFIFGSGRMSMSPRGGDMLNDVVRVASTEHASGSVASSSPMQPLTRSIVGRKTDEMHVHKQLALA